MSFLARLLAVVLAAMIVAGSIGCSAEAQSAAYHRKLEREQAARDRLQQREQQRQRQEAEARDRRTQEVSRRQSDWHDGDPLADNETDDDFSLAPARRQRGAYLAFTGGGSFPDDLETDSGDASLDAGFSGAVAFGARLRRLRVEGEFGYRKNDVDDLPEGDLTSSSFMANAYLDFPIRDRTQLYVGAGIGGADVELEFDFFGATVETDDSAFAWQFMAGAAIYLQENLALTGGYRLWTTSDIELGGEDVDMPLFHTAEVGLRIEF